MAFWNRNRTKSLVETQFSVESPPLFTNGRVIWFSLIAILLVLVLGLVGMGVLFLNGLEDSTIVTESVRIIIDNSVLRD